MAGKSVEVEQSGRALKVHTHSPHFVSLGGGRWSTAVTLHQIPEGRQSLGSTIASDIVIKGKGVEPVHCYLQNDQGSVTLYPIDQCDVTVDGAPLLVPTKLTQGSTVCIGKNSSFRYNNPAEASVMKKSLSDSFRRKTKRSKSKSPATTQHDSWDSLTSADELLANLISPKVFPSNSVTVNSPASFVLGPNKFPTHLPPHNTSPKPPLDLDLTNGLSRHHQTLSPKPQHRTLTTPSPAFDRNPVYSSGKAVSAPQTPVTRKTPPSPLDIHALHSEGEDQSSLDQARSDLAAEQVRLEEILTLCSDYERQIQWEKNHKPQPNRIITNGSLPRDKRLHSPTVVPSPVHAQTFTFDTDQPPTPSDMSSPNTPVLSPVPGPLSHPGSPRTRIKTFVGNNEYTSPCVKQTENSLDLLEKKLALLNDIELISSLNKSSTGFSGSNQYVQDKSTSTGPATSVAGCDGSGSNSNAGKHKFLGLQDPVKNNTGNNTDALSRSFHGFTSHSNNADTIDNKSVGCRQYGYSNNNHCIQEEDNETDASHTLGDLMSKSLNLGPPHLDSDDFMSRSYHGNAPQGAVNDMSRSYHGAGSVNNNNLFTGSNQGGKATNKYLLSSILNNSTKANNNYNRSFSNGYATIKKENNLNSSPASNVFYYTNSIDRRSHKTLNLNTKQELLEKEKEKIEGLVTELEALVKSPNKNNSPMNGKVDAVSSLINAFNGINHSEMDVVSNINEPHNAKSSSGKNNSITNSTKQNGLNNSLHNTSGGNNSYSLTNSSLSSSGLSNGSLLKNDQFILPLEDIDSALKKQRASLNGDIDELKEKRGKLLSELSAIKSNVQEIQQQEQELSRELEMEKAFLDAEWASENTQLAREEKRIASLQTKIAECEIQMDKCKQQQKDRQLHCKQSLEQQQSVLKTLQQQLTSCSDSIRPDLTESIEQQQELLESEKKSFEDLEFSLLEEEADWLSRREELQREVNECSRSILTRRAKLSELTAGRDSIARNAADETSSLNSQLLNHLRRIEDTRQRLRELDLTLADISNIRGVDFTPASTDTEEDESSRKDMKKQSQDDIDRITRVTSDAPIMESNSNNSLGRRTIASLQEIEKHRQLHLAKQGSLVIEEERKRVLELKKRVQEEVKMQWEHDHKHICDELTPSLSPSIEINEPPSEEFEKMASDHPLSSSSVSPDSMYSKSITSSSFRDTKEDRDPESRPMSDSSAYSEDQLSVRLRSSKSNVQRPLTRYLPFRGSSPLDLRLHIEAAGHQLETCSAHLSLDSSSCRGYLNKMATGRFTTNWKRRWFVLDRTARCLVYYADRTEKKRRGAVYFRCIEEVYVDHLNTVKSPSPHLTFVVKASDRTFHLMAPSPEAMRVWIDVIFSGAEGYQEFGQ